MTKLATAEAMFEGPRAVQAPWLEERRARALETILRQGVPNRRVEDWKYSDLKSALEAANDITLGRIAWSVSPLPQGCELFDLESLSKAPEWIREHFGKSAGEAAVPAASFVYGQSGFALRILEGVTADEPVSIRFSGAGHARALIVLEEAADVTLVETPATGAFSNIGVEAVVGRRANLTLVRLADEAPGAIQLEDVALRLAGDATFRAHLVNGGAKLGRLNLRMTLRDAGANAFISGASVLGGPLHADVTTHVYHAAGGTQSTQLFKKVVSGKARGVYQGKITVAEGANGSDSRQTAKAVLLSDRAEADLKPELEILADDVKCAHGAAIGDLDAEALFYLRSRGVPEREARNLLIRAFLEDALLAIEKDELRDLAWARVERTLARVMETSP